MMDDVLAGLDFCFCYMDNILVASKSGQVYFADLARAPEKCSEVLSMRDNVSLEVEKVEVAGVPPWRDTSTSQLRPLVPLAHHKTVFEAVHGLAHLGI